MTRIKLQNQNGFTIIEFLLILVIAGILGGTGYYVYHSQQQTNKTLTSAGSENIASSVKTKKSATTQQTQQGEASSWYQYKAPNGKFAISLADGWKATEFNGDSSLYIFSAANLSYSAGVKATVEKTQGGRDFADVPFLVSSEDTAPQANLITGDKQANLKTNQGLTISVYKTLQSGAGEGMGPSAGTVTYTFYVNNNKTWVYVRHDEAPGDPDNLAIVEKVVKTIEVY